MSGLTINSVRLLDLAAERDNKLRLVGDVEQVMMTQDGRNWIHDDRAMQKVCDIYKYKIFFNNEAFDSYHGRTYFSNRLLFLETFFVFLKTFCFTRKSCLHHEKRIFSDGETYY